MPKLGRNMVGPFRYYVIRIVLGVSIAVNTYAASIQKEITTTHAPTTTFETNEFDGYNFYYDPHMHHLFAKQFERFSNGSVHETCYITQLSKSEWEAIHNDYGLRAMELKVFAKLSEAYEADKSSLHFRDIAACGQQKNGYVTIMLIGRLDQNPEQLAVDYNNITFVIPQGK